MSSSIYSLSFKQCFCTFFGDVSIILSSKREPDSNVLGLDHLFGQFLGQVVAFANHFIDFSCHGIAAVVCPEYTHLLPKNQRSLCDFQA